MFYLYAELTDQICTRYNNYSTAHKAYEKFGSRYENKSRQTNPLECTTTYRQCCDDSRSTKRTEMRRGNKDEKYKKKTIIYCKHLILEVIFILLFLL